MLKWALIITMLFAAIFAGRIAYRLVPSEDPRPLPAALISFDSAAGRQLLSEADALADYDDMAEHFEAQKLTSFCGVASSVIVLNALDRDVSQLSLFNERASEVRPAWQVALNGMTLEIISEIIASHGVSVATQYADTSSVAEFRRTVIRNLSEEDDYVLVNYQRGALGQDRVGHISPIAAYDEETDRVLVLDTASYKYPHTWVPLDDLFQAMMPSDAESGVARGWVEVGNDVRTAQSARGSLVGR
ncbi:phytochelatin synthase family protein [Altererythrobacter arenosus]|uniref:glutathione gamma-glutamylcysteinyltransferase n=1 Tax=Altererythrobacter arenosus TaxID=3032592 RepID=A0ABY8G199_9SPHN|nr:phytochelatin synthase family protein [Altererythrobacter sp. CAU 1644]WFL78214.1 phytochelatin synthase family protein [Altererythrobacter sp. CAU 1644]